MKIAVLSDLFPPYKTGGAEHIAYLLAKEYVTAGHTVFVITTSQNKNLSVVADLGGINVYRLYTNIPERLRPWSSLYNPQVVPMVRNILTRKKPDVIHAHNIHNYLSYQVLKVIHALQIPAVMTLHDAMSFAYGKYYQFIDPTDISPLPNICYKPLGFWATLKANRFRTIPFRNFIIKTYLQKYVTKLVSVSHELQQALHAHGIKDAMVVPNGIDVGAFTADPQQVIALKNVYDLHDKRIVLFAGRISYLKGGEHLLKAMKMVCTVMHDAVLLIVGKQTGYGNQMQQMAKDLGIAHRVIFTGWLSREDLMTAYQCCNVAVTPSIYLDNFPTVNLEAMAMKRPVIATCFGGSKELVLDGITGYIVNPFNTEMMAERIIDLLHDKTKARQMGEAGYQHIIQNFTIQQQGQKMITLLHEAVINKQ